MFSYSASVFVLFFNFEIIIDSYETVGNDANRSHIVFIQFPPMAKSCITTV